MFSLKCTALEKVGVPGMLEGRRLDEGRRAGLTNSPDFFRRSGGLTVKPISSSLSSEVWMGESVKEAVLWLDRLISLADLEWAILRASGVKPGLASLNELEPKSDTAIPLLFPAGDPSRLISICCNACANWASSPVSCIRRLPRSSSSELLLVESGGVLMAPDGIAALLTGGGDCRRLGLATSPLFSDDSVFELAWSEMEGVRRCRWRYVVDESERGSVGRD
jgi:hypothetical protein